MKSNELTRAHMRVCRYVTTTTTLVLLLSMHRETLDQRDQRVNLVLLDSRFVLLSVY